MKLSNTYAESITATVREPLIVLDEALQVVAASRSFYSQFGLQKGHSIGHSIYELDDGQWNSPDLRRLLETIIPERENIEDFEVRHNFGTADEKVLLLNARRIVPEDGKPALIILAIEDINARSAGQEALEEKSAMLDALLESIPEAILVTDVEHVVKRVSRYTGEIFGLPPDNLVDTDEPMRLDLLELYWPNGERLKSPNELPLSKAAITGETYTNFDVTLKRDGVIKFLSAAAAPVRDSHGTIVGAIGGWRDITGLKRAEKALRESEERFAAAFRASPDALVVSEVESGTIVDVNNTWSSHWGFSREQSVGRRSLELGIFTNPDDRRRAVKQMRDAGRLVDFNIELRTKTGELRQAVLSTEVLKLRDKNLMLTIIRDETERKRAEAQHYSERELLQTIIDSVPAMISIYDPQIKDVRLNKAFFQTTGWSPEDLQKTNVMELVYPNPEYREMVMKYMQALSPGFKDLRMVTRNGGVIETAWSNVPLPDGRQVGIGIDITERKRAEDALRESQQRFYTMANAIPQLAWIAHGDGYIHWYNQRWYEYTGTTPEQMEGWGWQSVHDPNMLPSVLEQWKKSISTGESFDMEFPLRGADGVFRPFLTRVMPFKDAAGHVMQWFGTNTDITERKLAEQRLAQALEEAEEGRNVLTALMEYIPIGITIAGAPDVNIRMISKFGQKIMEKSSEKLAGIPAPEHPSKWGIWHADGVTPGTPDELPLTRATTKGEIVRNEEWIVTRNDGTLVPILCNAAPILDEEGKVVGGIIGWSDVTEQRKSRKALERYAEQLAAANRDLESFSYSISHDLRNPLRTIGGFTEIIREDYADQLDEEGRDYLGRIDDGVKKMQKLIDDMLSLSRVGKQEINREDVDLSKLVHDYLQDLKATEPARQAEFVIQDNVRANADPRMIHLALENLLRNAWKFTAKKEVARIEFGTTVKGDQNIYFIRDNGAGFDMQFAEKIFEPFKRVHAEKEFGGTGVGLSIVQRVIARHGGKVWAEGIPGKGAVFYLTLPQSAKSEP